MTVATKEKQGKQKVQGVNIPLVHLVTGYVKKKNGKFQIYKGSLDTFRNRIFVLEDANKKLNYLKSNKKGVVNKLSEKDIEDTKFQFRGVGIKKQKMYLPPPEALLMGWLDDTKSWDDVLGGYLKKHPAGYEVDVIKIRKSMFRAPDRSSTEEDEKEYVQWYENFGENEVHTGVLLAKARAAVFVFNDSKLINEEIVITPPENSLLSETIIRPTVEQGLVHAVLAGDDAELVPGLYKIKIPVTDTDKWSQTVKQDQSYTLVEPLRFEIQNLAGEFDIVNCAPISLESAMLQQFPSSLSHIITQLKKDNNPALTGVQPTINKKPAQSASNGKKEPDYDSVISPGMRELGKEIDFWYNKSKMAINTVNDFAEVKMASLMVTVSKTIEKNYPEFEPVSHTINTTYGTYKAAKTWVDYLDEIEILDKMDKNLGSLKEFVKNNAGGRFHQGKWWTYIYEVYKDEDTADAMKEIMLLTTLKDEKEIKKFLAVVPEHGAEKLTNFQRAMKKIGKVTTAIDVGISVIQFGLAVDKVVGTYDKLQDNKDDTDKLFEDYHKVIRGEVCREAMFNLERLRAATVSSQLQFDEASADAVAKFFDMALGVMALFPTPLGLVARGILAVKGVVQISQDVASLIQDGVDSFFMEGRWKEEDKIRDMLSDNTKGSFANQRLMPDEDDLRKEMKESQDQREVTIYRDGNTKSLKIGVGKNYFHVQYRMRAEALYGLFGILVRASLKCEKDDFASFEKSLEKYKVKEYINHFLMSDGWVYDLDNQGRLDMDTWWMNHKSKYALRTTKKVHINGWGPGVYFLQDIFEDDYEFAAESPLAAYNQHFPIHKYTSQDFHDICAMLTPADLIDNTDDWIDETLVYYRESKKGQAIDAGWKLINEADVNKWEKLPVLTPFHELRVLVTLKDKNEEGKALPPGIYPISLQLCRRDGATVTGPIYKGTIRYLIDEMLLHDEKKKYGPEKTTDKFNKVSYKKRKGIVFYPFFEFGEQIFFGTKPMLMTGGKKIMYTMGEAHIAHANAFNPFDNNYKYFSSLTIADMEYGFKVKLGKTNEDWDWIKLGTKGSGKNSLHTYRVQTDKNNKEHQKLNIKEFLESHTTSFELPSLWEDPRLGSFYVKVGSRPFQMISYSNDVLTFNDYQWGDESVDIYVILTAEDVYREKYEKFGTWRELGFEARLEHIGDNTEEIGPVYKTTLYYIGEMHGSKQSDGNYFKYDEKKNKIPNREEDYDEFLTFMQNKGNQKKLRYTIDKSDYWDNSKYDLYVAKFSLSYRTPAGKNCPGLRPLASKVINNDYYEFVLRNLISEGKSGLNESKMEGDDYEYTIKVKAPSSYKNVAAWQGVTDFQKWIVKQSSEVNAQGDLSIVAGKEKLDSLRE